MNKLLLLVLAAVMLSFSASAQLTKGHKLLGGSISGATNKIEGSNGNEYNNRVFSISPSLGFFVADNKAVGFTIGYSTTNYNGTKGHSYSAGSFYRQYLPISQRFYLFGEAALNLTTGKDNNFMDGVGFRETRRWGAAASFTPGIAFAATKRFYLEAAINSLVGISYQHTKSEYPGVAVPFTEKGNNFSLSSNVVSNTPISVGFQILLGK